MYSVSTPVELSADDVDVVDQHPDAHPHPPKMKKIKESHPANSLGYLPFVWDKKMFS